MKEKAKARVSILPHHTTDGWGKKDSLDITENTARPPLIDHPADDGCDEPNEEEIVQVYYPNQQIKVSKSTPDDVAGGRTTGRRWQDKVSVRVRGCDGCINQGGGYK